MKDLQMLRQIALFFCLSLPLQANLVQAETALAAVAANFADTAKALAAQFQADTGHEIQITTGSTGKLYAQISQGAPFDLLLSADVDTPTRLSREGHGKPQPYAVGLLTLWAPSLPQDTDPMAALLDPSLRHVAIANPDLAPYGKAAMTAITAMGLEATLNDKIVMGQNIGQTFALVESGAAEAGFIAGSALPEGAKGLVWNVAPGLYPPIQQDAVLLKHGADNAAAVGFLEYLGSSDARDMIARNGYGLP